MKNYLILIKATLIIFAVLFCLSAVGTIVDHILPVSKGSDFASFVMGARIVADGKGGGLYSIPLQTRYEDVVGARYTIIEYLPFRNLPPVALAFLPFAFMSLPVSFSLFLLLNIAVLVGFVVLSSKHFRPIGGAAVVAFIVFSFRPVVSTLQLGQLSIIFLLLYLGVYIALIGKKEILLGLLAGLLILRPQMLTVIPFLFILVGDKRKFAVGFGLTAFLILVISIVVVGAAGAASYPQFLFATEVSSLASPPWRMFSVIPLFTQTMENVGLLPVFALIPTIVMYFVTLVVLARTYRKVDKSLTFLLITVSTLVFSPHVLAYDLTILLVPVVAILGLANKLKVYRVRVIFIVGVVWLFSLVGFIKVVYFAAPVFWTFCLMIQSAGEWTKLKK